MSKDEEINLKRCGNPKCKRSDIELKQCAGCYQVFYCGRNCQKIDWKKTHKGVCSKVKCAAEQVSLCITKQSLLPSAADQIALVSYTAEPELSLRNPIASISTCVVDSPGFSVFEGTFNINSTPCKVYIASHIGRREYQEDRLVNVTFTVNDNEYFLFCVLDGHGGSDCVDTAASQLPICLYDALRKFSSPEEAICKTFIQLDTICKDIISGTCVTGILLSNGIKLSFNLGDSCVRTETFCTKDHKPTDKDEQKWIVENGAKVWAGRLDGRLAVSRALGDKEIFLTLREDANLLELECMFVKPDITPIPGGDNTIILASDGITDSIRHDRLLELAKSVTDTIQPEQLSKTVTDSIQDDQLSETVTVSNIIKEALQYPYCGDNCTIIVVRLDVSTHMANAADP